jgi:trk system potassium uptake protein TrkA
MYIIVIGCGKVGSKFAEILSDEGHDVVIVDNDSNALKLLSNKFNGIRVTGVPIDQDVLKQAGIENADIVAAVTPDDNVNVMVCQVAKEIFNVPKVIARIYNPSREHVFREFGIETICPTELTVKLLHSRISDGNSVSNHLIGRNNFTFKYVQLPKRLEGKNIENAVSNPDEAVFGIIRDNNFVFPSKSIILDKEDILILAQKDSGGI